MTGLNPAGPTVRVAAHIGLRPWRGGPSGALEMARLDEAHARRPALEDKRRSRQGLAQWLQTKQGAAAAGLGEDAGGGELADAWGVLEDAAGGVCQEMAKLLLLRLQPWHRLHQPSALRRHDAAGEDQLVLLPQGPDVGGAQSEQQGGGDGDVGGAH